MHICLECLGLSLAECVRHSPLLCCIQTLEPRSRSSSMAPTTTWRTPTTRSSLEVPGRRPRLFDHRSSICVLCWPSFGTADYLCLYSAIVVVSLMYSGPSNPGCTVSSDICVWCRVFDILIVAPRSWISGASQAGIRADCL